MKKSLLLIACLSLACFACKKDKKTVSQVQTVSYPTITFSGPSYFSIPIGGTLPTISASASDTATGETGLPVTITGTSGLDNTTPGLYFVQAEARNKYGFVTRQNVYVAVTDVSPDMDISGIYVRDVNNDSVNITKVATGLYRNDDLGGAPTFKVVAYMVQIDDTTIIVPPQPSSAGTISAEDVTLSLTPPDTILSYRVINRSFGTAIRTFVKVH